MNKSRNFRFEVVHSDPEFSDTDKTFPHLPFVAEQEVQSGFKNDKIAGNKSEN